MSASCKRWKRAGCAAPRSWACPWEGWSRRRMPFETIGTPPSSPWTRARSRALSGPWAAASLRCAREPLAKRFAETVTVVGFDRKRPAHPPPAAECLYVDISSEPSLRRGLRAIRDRHGDRLASVVRAEEMNG